MTNWERGNLNIVGGKQCKYAADERSIGSLLAFITKYILTISEWNGPRDPTHYCDFKVSVWMIGQAN